MVAAGKRSQLQLSVHGNHVGENLDHVLGHRPIVDVDQVLGLRVDLERLVECQRGFDVACAWRGRKKISTQFFATPRQSSIMIHTFRAQGLSLGDLGHEEALSLFNVGREALLFSFLHRNLDGFFLFEALGLGFLANSAGESTVVALQRASEVGVRLSLVVEVDGVG